MKVDYYATKRTKSKKSIGLVVKSGKGIKSVVPEELLEDQNFVLKGSFDLKSTDIRIGINSKLILESVKQNKFYILI
jgi:hypothetical protein